MIRKIERLIDEINKLHLSFSKDYFETGKVQKVNLKHTFSKVPLEHILSYRLNLHESNNDYFIVPIYMILLIFIELKLQNLSWIKSNDLNNVAKVSR